MSERLAEIKRKANREPMGSNDDRRWLIAKVERLEAAAAEACALVDRYWKFDERQMHMHSWHDKQDCLAALRSTGDSE